MDTIEVMKGQHLGKKVWICRYHRPSFDKKPLRCVPPTHVLVRSNEELPKGKNVYYSVSHFVVLNKKGEPSSKIHSPVDATGWRNRSGDPVFTFSTEEECKSSWNEQINEHLLRLEEYVKSEEYRLTSEKDLLLERLMK